MPHHLRILHLSDLHERVAADWMPHARKAQIKLGAPARYRVLGSAFEQILRDDVLQGGPLDLLCFTGDVADWGLPAEYEKTQARFSELLQLTGVSPSRFFAIPGNHDVQRKVEKNAWKKLRKLSVAPEMHMGLSNWLGGMSAPRGASKGLQDAILKRTEAFWSWLGRQRGDEALLPSNNPHGRLGYRHTFAPGVLFPFPVHLIGLDSAWLAGDEHDTGKLLLTAGQIDLLCNDGELPLPGLRLAMLHHPLDCLGDKSESQNLLASSVDLLLHGHQHKPTSERFSDPDRALRILAAGSLFEGDIGDHWLNSFQRIDLELDDQGKILGSEITFYGWSDRGHWHRTGAIYNEARDGVLREGSLEKKTPSLAPP